MNKVVYLTVFAVLLFTACNNDESIAPENGIPVVQAESTYTILKDENITYAEGLSHSMTSASSFAIPLKLDIYYPDNNSTNRPCNQNLVEFTNRILSILGTIETRVYVPRCSSKTYSKRLWAARKHHRFIVV